MGLSMAVLGVFDTYVPFPGVRELGLCSYSVPHYKRHPRRGNFTLLYQIGKIVGLSRHSSHICTHLYTHGFYCCCKFTAVYAVNGCNGLFACLQCVTSVDGVITVQ